MIILLRNLARAEGRADADQDWRAGAPMQKMLTSNDPYTLGYQERWREIRAAEKAQARTLGAACGCGPVYGDELLGQVCKDCGEAFTRIVR
jgi:hypothetical protein